MKDTDYYRRITERLPKGLSEHMKQFFIFLLSATALVFICLLVFLFFKYQTALDERKKVSDSLLYWEDVVKHNPNLPDAYYNSAVYSIELGENNAAVGFLNQAIELDPSFGKAIELKKQIE